MLKIYLHNAATLAAYVFLSTTSVAVAANVYYEKDFEDGTLSFGVASPVWSLQPQNAAKYGAGNFFEVVAGNAHSGNYSLRFNYEGRNGICNTCGQTSRIQKNGYDNVNYFVDSGSIDLTQDPVLAATGRLVYNISDGWSKWTITSIANQSGINDKLMLNIVAVGIGAPKNTFNSGNTVNIYRQCGVDGTVGGNIDRRSDCDIAISYFDGITQLPQLPGESIFRRVYIKFDPQTILPYNQKLRYWDVTNGSIYLVVRYSQTDGRIFPYVEGLQTLGGPGFVDSGVTMSPNVWYYVEEEFKAQSSAGVLDGEYRLWFAKAGEETATPVINVTGLNMGIVKNASLWGNHQHFNDSSGYWYIDDLKISNVHIGPTGATTNTLASPNPPSNVVVK